VGKRVGKAVCLRPQEYYGNGSIADALLLGKTLVHGNEYVEPLGHRVKERPVVEIRPAHFRRRVNLVILQFTG